MIIMMEIDERSLSDRLKSVGNKIIKSSFFSEVLSYIDLKELIKL